MFARREAIGCLCIRSMGGHWNYRVLKHGDGSFAIHEVYYDNDGKPDCCTAEPAEFVDDSLEELSDSLECACRGLTEAVLLYESFGSKEGVTKA